MVLDLEERKRCVNGTKKKETSDAEIYYDHCLIEILFGVDDGEGVLGIMVVSDIFIYKRKGS